MNDYFFIRFSLQQSCGIFGSNQFDCNSIISLTAEQTADYINECESWQRARAGELADKFGGRIKPLAGKRVMFIGDSITADRLSYRGIVVKAAGLLEHNTAFSGATSADMLRGVYDGIHSFKPDIVSILIGGNDAFFSGGGKKVNLISRREYRRNLRAIIRTCRDSGARVIVSAIPIMDEKSFAQNNDVKVRYNNNRNIAAYNRIVREEAAKTGFIDLEEILKKSNADGLFEPDGIHLSRKGQLIAAENWLRTAADI